MQLFTLFKFAILVGAVSAVPTPEAAVKVDVETALHHLSIKKAAGCSMLKCIIALAPTMVACAAAVAEDGVNIIADYGCIVSAANAGINTPSACTACF